MIKIDDTGLLLAKYQSNLFEISVKELSCSSSYFYKKFAFSKLAQRMDKKTFIMESLDITSAIEELKNESNYEVGHIKVSPAIMAWIGYIMTYFSCVTSLPQSVLYENMKPEEFYQIYEAYHSLDNDMVVKRIIESKNINIELNNVELMRKIYNI